MIQRARVSFCLFLDQTASSVKAFDCGHTILLVLLGKAKQLLIAIEMGIILPEGTDSDQNVIINIHGTTLKKVSPPLTLGRK